MILLLGVNILPIDCTDVFFLIPVLANRITKQSHPI